MAAKPMNPNVNVLLHGTTRPEELVPLSQLVETLGFAEVWLAEDYFYLGGFATAAMVLQATQRISVGLGVVSSVVRHPAVTAMEISTLARAHPGRFTPGIGHGVPLWTRQMGLYPKSVLASLREAITTIRRLLAGETVTQHGEYFHFDQVSLAHPVNDVELYTGVLGPKSLELAGEIADGTILSIMSSEAYIRFARTQIERGMQRAGRTAAHALPTFALYAVDRDRDIARRAAREIIAFYLGATGVNGQTEILGLNDALADMINRGGAEILAREMPDDWIDLFAIAGEPEECADRTRSLLAAGASSVILAPVMTDRTKSQLELTVESVMPKL